jgi:hypothetical protein
MTQEERRVKSAYRILFLVLFIVISTACAGPTPSAASDWQTYTNAEAGFRIQYPSPWKLEALPDQNSGALHGVSLKGAEGGVELYWGVGLGGGCTPEAIQTIKVAQGELNTCYGKTAEGTERWENISKNLSSVSFSARAFTADTAVSSHNLVLKVISTLSFP